MSSPAATPPRERDRAAVVVPVKAFGAAKVRLADALDAGERAELARSMATAVVAAAGSLPVAIACEDDEVAAWARDCGADVLWTPGTGLNGAVEASVSSLEAAGYATIVVAHGDLPYAAGLERLVSFPGITLVPDRHDDGTNVIVLPARSGFRFAYGAGSFTRHVVEARRCGGALRIARVAALGWDVDTPADLPVPAAN